MSTGRRAVTAAPWRHRTKSLWRQRCRPAAGNTVAGHQCRAALPQVNEWSRPCLAVLVLCWPGPTSTARRSAGPAGSLGPSVSERAARPGGPAGGPGPGPASPAGAPSCHCPKAAESDGHRGRQSDAAVLLASLCGPAPCHGPAVALRRPCHVTRHCPPAPGAPARRAGRLSRRHWSPG